MRVMNATGGHPPIYSSGPGREPRYRDRPLADLLDLPFESVWGLLVDGSPVPALPPAEPFPLPVRTGDARVDVQSAVAQLAPVWGFRPLLDIAPERAREDLARATVLALSFVAQSARSPEVPAVPQQEVERGGSVAERFLIRWSGAAPADHAWALDALWTVLAEAGPQAPSTLITRMTAGTGADVGACLVAGISAVSGPLAAGAAARAHRLARSVHDGQLSAQEAVRQGRRTQRALPGMWPADLSRRAQLLREVCAKLRVRLHDAAAAIESAGREETPQGLPEHLALPLWGAALIDHVGLGPRFYNALIVCARTAGWSAHVLEAQRELLAVSP